MKEIETKKPCCEWRSRDLSVTEHVLSPMTVTRRRNSAVVSPLSIPVQRGGVF